MGEPVQPWTSSRSHGLGRGDHSASGGRVPVSNHRVEPSAYRLAPKAWIFLALPCVWPLIESEGPSASLD